MKMNINKLQKEVDDKLMQCRTDSEKSILKVYLEKDLSKLGYTLSQYEKVIK